MRALVIGHTGQLARALGEQEPGLPRFGRERLDLTEPEPVERTVRDCAPDLVINAAAYTDVDGAEDEPELAYAVNRDGVAALARAAASAQAALIHVSTDYVFDGSKEGEWVENDPTGPLNVYGASKLAGDEAAVALNPRTLVLRTSWVYSPWGKNFVITMLRLAERERLTVVGDQTGKPTSALSLARAVLAIAPRVAAAPAEAPVWGVRHYAGHGATSWAGFAREVFRLAAGRLTARVPEVVDIPTSKYPTRARRPLNSALDCTAFERDFGVNMEDWRGALAEVIERIGAEASVQ